MKQIPHISIVIPALNEEKRLPATLEAVQEYLSCYSSANTIVQVICLDLARHINRLLYYKNKKNISMHIPCRNVRKVTVF